MSAKSAGQHLLPWTSSAAGSPVKTSHPLARELALLAIGAACGTSSLASLKKCARAGSSSRTSQAERTSGLTPCEEDWNGSVMQAYRSRLRRLISELPTNAHAFSSSLYVLPTLTTKTWHRHKMAGGEQVSLREAVPLLPTMTTCNHARGRNSDGGPRLGNILPLLPTLTLCGNYNRQGASETSGDGLATRLGSGPLNPTWLEWYMGFEDGWTASVRSATRLSRSKRKSSDGSSER